MNVQKIKGKIGRGLAGIVLGSGLVAGVSGCETGMETSLLGTIISGGALGPGVTAQQAAGYELLGSGIQTAGQVQAIENSGSRTTVNVYNSRGEIEKQPTQSNLYSESFKHNWKNRKDCVFACNSWVDDGNGLIEPRELCGIEKEVFRRIEPIIIGGIFFEKVGHTIKTRMFDPDKTLLYEKVEQSNRDCFPAGFNFESSTLEKPGEYNIQFYDNGNLVAELNVLII